MCVCVYVCFYSRSYSLGTRPVGGVDVLISLVRSPMSLLSWHLELCALQSDLVLLLQCLYVSLPNRWVPSLVAVVSVRFCTSQPFCVLNAIGNFSSRNCLVASRPPVSTVHGRAYILPEQQLLADWTALNYFVLRSVLDVNVFWVAWGAFDSRKNCPWPSKGTVVFQRRPCLASRSSEAVCRLPCKKKYLECI